LNQERRNLLELKKIVRIGTIFEASIEIESAIFFLKAENLKIEEFCDL